MSNQWNSGINDRKIKEQICEIGRRVYNKGFAAANDGNISYRVGDNEVLCSPTMICKGFMTPDDICAVDLNGNQLAGKRKRTSEILLHLAIMKARPDIRAVVHCHPPHATAFGVAREPIPQCVLPEIEVFLGEIPFAPYSKLKLSSIGYYRYSRDRFPGSPEGMAPRLQAWDSPVGGIPWRPAPSLVARYRWCWWLWLPWPVWTSLLVQESRLVSEWSVDPAPGWRRDRLR